jgi:pimeloyl-ACP methyl ester carboxylesterase
MTAQPAIARPDRPNARERLLAGLPVTERRMTLSGISTSLLVGGEGPPLILLHGPGEFAGKWLRVIPDLVTTFRVIAPDLPAHGASAVPAGPVTRATLMDWLDALIEHTTSTPPVLLGHVLGGAIAARYAAGRSGRIRELVLVDTLGLAPFRPTLRFAAGLIRFQLRPTERNYDRFMRQCSYDLDRLQAEMGERWEPFKSYNLETANSPASKVVGTMLRMFGLGRIPSEELERIKVPTTLIWGREDRATRLRIAERASARYGWPLHVIEDCADDPPRDKPAEFLAVLRKVLMR